MTENDRDTPSKALARHAKVLARSVGQTIVCDVCGQEKYYKLFHKRRSGVRDGTCNECKTARSTAWYNANKRYAVIRQMAYNSGRPYTREQLALIRNTLRSPNGESLIEDILDAINRDRETGGTGLPRVENEGEEAEE